MKNAYAIMPLGEKTKVFKVAQKQIPQVRAHLRDFIPFGRGGLSLWLTT